ncbi:response regulator [Deminuibacter soli]|uniref:Response regulator n=1 Tax=Deminuibacter soli TaxID=2291815 RepID=A0A3E1NPW8_9BACT|nr:response regulator [Deminuibacter soli]RFM29963.1 response regulator [Deminuibacter soli]
MTKKILLADDDSDDRFIFDQVFEDLGYSRSALDFVENGIEVIQYLDAIPGTGNLPNLIILDHNMPKMNGMQTLSYLKTSDRYKHITVIIYSTYNDAVFMDQCTRLGAEATISKPSSYEEYTDMVKSFLNTGR